MTELLGDQLLEGIRGQPLGIRVERHQAAIAADDGRASTRHIQVHRQQHVELRHRAHREVLAQAVGHGLVDE